MRDTLTVAPHFPEGEISVFQAAALALSATYPWSIIPIRNDGEGHKKAACAWKEYQTRRPTADEINRMFAPRTLTGLGVIPGEVSGGLWGRDLDKIEAYDRWAAHYPALALTLPTVETARGRHVYGYSPEVVQTRELPDGELRGEGAYLLLPPSIHPTGKRYTWVVLPRLPCPEVTIAPDVAGLDRAWLSDPDSDHLIPSPSVTQGTQRTQGSQELSGRGRGHAGLERAGGVPPDLLWETIPNGPSQNHRALFTLARRVRGLEVERGEAYSMADLRAAVTVWCAKNHHLRPEQAEADYLEEFMEAYEVVRVPYRTEGTLDTTWRLALVAAPPPEAAQYGESFGLLAAWCRELQRVAGGRAFYLGSRTVQQRFGLAAPLLAWRRLRLLCRLGVLEPVDAGDRRRAATFRYRLPL